MPDFVVRGNPGGVLARAATMRGKAESFSSTGDGLARITTDGWSSRAADRFRDKFDTEPERWRTAGDGFRRAAASLEAYAEALTSAQQRARWAEAEYARGEQVTRDAQAAYDADVARARQEASVKEAAGMIVTLTIVPFSDPGEAVRQGALAELASARADLESAAHTCANGVRAGCAGAPEERAWYESVGAAVGGFLQGAGEALLDLGKMAMWLGNPAMMLTQDLIGDARSGMTAEEIAAKWQLKGEDAQGMLDALQDDPVAFGKELGKAMLDWDTWADDPARALGHLVPDAIAAVLTAGTGAAATRGVRAGDDMVDGLQAVGRMDDLAEVRRLEDLGDTGGGLGRSDEGTDLGRLDEMSASKSGYPLHDSADGFRHLTAQMNDPHVSRSMDEIIEPGYDPLGGRPSPDSFLHEFRDGDGWRWPPDDGKVPGSESWIEPAEAPRRWIASAAVGAAISPTMARASVIVPCRQAA